MGAKVTIYVTNYCPFCRQAERLLKQKGVSFDAIDVTDDSDMREALIQKSGGRTTVPQIFAGERCIGGYDDLVKLYQSGGRL